MKQNQSGERQNGGRGGQKGKGEKVHNSGPMGLVSHCENHEVCCAVGYPLQ
jgi:hypothetical protein